MAKNVLIVQRRMVKYRIPLFESLKESLARNNVNLSVLYGTPSKKEVLKSDDEKLTWGFKSPCKYFNLKGHQVVFMPIPKSLLKRQNLLIIPHENSFIINYYLMLSRHLVKPPLAFWGHGANFQSSKPSGFLEKLKFWTINKADWWFAYTQLSVERIKAAGFPENQITCLNNAIDIDQLVEWQKTVKASKLEELKVKLKLKGTHVGVFIGSLYTQKRIDFLFEACEKLKQMIPDFELIIIGDGPMWDYVRINASKHSWIKWVGAKYEYEKVMYLSLGKIILNPGLVGLCILDSFAMGLPLVTTDCGIHSPEIAYLISGQNGLMTENTLDAFTNSIFNLFTDNKFYESMSSACKDDRYKYSLVKMSDNFCDGIYKALGHG